MFHANKTIYDPSETVTITTNIGNKGTVVSSTSTLTLKRKGITIDSRSVPSLGASSTWGTAGLSWQRGHYNNALSGIGL